MNGLKAEKVLLYRLIHEHIVSEIVNLQSCCLEAKRDDSTKKIWRSLYT